MTNSDFFVNGSYQLQTYYIIPLVPDVKCFACGIGEGEVQFFAHL
jgi:hypothetical protein